MQGYNRVSPGMYRGPNGQVTRSQQKPQMPTSPMTQAMVGAMGAGGMRQMPQPMRQNPQQIAGQIGGQLGYGGLPSWAQGIPNKPLGQMPSGAIGGAVGAAGLGANMGEGPNGLHNMIQNLSPEEAAAMKAMLDAQMSQLGPQSIDPNRKQGNPSSLANIGATAGAFIPKMA